MNYIVDNNDFVKNMYMIKNHLPKKYHDKNNPKEKREELGIKDGLIRLSIGLETIDDILSDLKNALS